MAFLSLSLNARPSFQKAPAHAATASRIITHAQNLPSQHASKQPLKLSSHSQLHMTQQGSLGRCPSQLFVMCLGDDYMLACPGQSVLTEYGSAFLRSPVHARPGSCKQPCMLCPKHFFIPLNLCCCSLEACWHPLTVQLRSLVPQGAVKQQVAHLHRTPTCVFQAM